MGKGRKKSGRKMIQKTEQAKKKARIKKATAAGKARK